ncbi:single-stranded-DNA-specific exonuclease [Novimethylophilus kurashikiensis]|uniref:Single-stranded-DNA-specific exonuclease RecJ n=1 Tax=Novimethylophilus kurashikiensis TaxID=1825523 RepID=A0A2R5FC03_9PROT|nr:single-stranded-DNA-specific exonuclease RecJ [Novimethylophilus kurashikiensis]GBG14453.1 single-stranded-DNA-specific exonuclease [Novimethylophilus kurashikiensis]
MQLSHRAYSPIDAMKLVREGCSPILARVLAGRGIKSKSELAGDLGRLHHHSLLKGAAEAAEFLADAILLKRKLVVVADYDCDGATACAIAVRGLRAFGADVTYLVPDRMVHGYGLTPSVVDLAMENPGTPEVLLTVDNGIASHAGIAHAKSLGLDVVVTDHHLPSKVLGLPNAEVIVDPSQPGCDFPSKALAGCGVIWYVLWALQDELRRRDRPIAPGFKVSSLLPLVAVGTVADVVALDHNNRVLIQAGLDKIRAGEVFPGIEALATAGAFNRCDPRALVTTDIAFGIGPRINAAGRLESMAIGIECLLSDEAAHAEALAERLDTINQERRQIEYDTIDDAVKQAMALIVEGRQSIVVHHPEWHAGVIGIVAGRIKEKRYRPTFVLTTADSGEIKGSGRSIPGFNLKDALDMVDKLCPGLMVKFGGHAMAAGVTLKAGGVAEFQRAFEEVACELLTDEILNQKVEVDGSLAGHDFSPATARKLRVPVWGQGFPEPAFCDTFYVQSAKITGIFKDQLNMTLERDGCELQATRFRHEGPIPEGSVKLVYKLNLTVDPKGREVVKLLVDHIL